MSAPDLGPSPLMAGDERPVDDARAAIAAALRPIAEVEQVPLEHALGRVLAQELMSPIDVPAHDNSAMDGYALRGTDLAGDGAATSLPALPVTVLAGAPLAEPVPGGHCVRIMTGAVMPPGLDTVVPLELCRVEGGVVTLTAGTVKPGEHRRRRGEDLARGGVALAQGRRLTPADLGLAASLGQAALPVLRRLRVALFSTGDELRNPGEALAPGCIYDSNRASLRAALQRLDVELLDLGLVPDDPARLRETLDRAIGEADAVITSGGVSVGDADHTRDLLAARGEVGFWKVAMRPGRPFAFGPLARVDGGTAWLFALPGNPVAALVSFYVFVREALLQLAGSEAGPPPAVRARSLAAIRKRPGRTEFQRAIAGRDAQGRWQVRLTGVQGAGILRSMSQANALVVLGHDQGPVAAGDEVEVWLFDGLI